MLNAANLLLMTFSAYRHDPAGQIFVFFIMAVAAAEVAVVEAVAVEVAVVEAVVVEVVVVEAVAIDE